MNATKNFLNELPRIMNIYDYPLIDGWIKLKMFNHEVEGVGACDSALITHGFINIKIDTKPVLDENVNSIHFDTTVALSDHITIEVDGESMLIDITDYEKNVVCSINHYYNENNLYYNQNTKSITCMPFIQIDVDDKIINIRL